MLSGNAINVTPAILIPLRHLPFLFFSPHRGPITMVHCWSLPLCLWALDQRGRSLCHSENCCQWCTLMTSYLMVMTESMLWVKISLLFATTLMPHEAKQNDNITWMVVFCIVLSVYFMIKDAKICRPTRAKSYRDQGLAGAPKLWRINTWLILLHFCFYLYILRVSFCML